MTSSATDAEGVSDVKELTSFGGLVRLAGLSKGRCKGKSITLCFVTCLTRAVAPDLAVLERSGGGEGVSNGFGCTLDLNDLHVIWRGVLGWHGLHGCSCQDCSEKDGCDLHVDSMYVECNFVSKEDNGLPVNCRR